MATSVVAIAPIVWMGFDGIEVVIALSCVDGCGNRYIKCTNLGVSHLHAHLYKGRLLVLQLYIAELH